MKSIRRAGIVVISTILLVVFCIFASAAAKPDTIKTLIKTPLYAEPSYSAKTVVPEIKQNEKVEQLEQPILDAKGVQWVKIRYNSHYEGYVPYSYLYFTVDNDGYEEIYVAKATGQKSSDEIKLYKYYDEKSETDKILHDGQKVNVVVEEDASYGDFIKIIYEGEYYFVKKDNVTTGLTYNQKLALIIAGGLIGGGLAVAFIVILLVKKKRASNKNK